MIATSMPTTAFSMVQLHEHSLQILTAMIQKNTILEKVKDLKWADSESNTFHVCVDYRNFNIPNKGKVLRTVY